MTRAVWCRTSFLLFLCLLPSLPLSAAEHRTQRDRDRGSRPIATLWQRLAALVPLVEALGAGMDPLGITSPPRPEPPPPLGSGDADLGPGMDPLG